MRVKANALWLAAVPICSTRVLKNSSSGHHRVTVQLLVVRVGVKRLVAMNCVVRTNIIAHRRVRLRPTLSSLSALVLPRLLMQMTVRLSCISARRQESSKSFSATRQKRDHEICMHAHLNFSRFSFLNGKVKK